MSDDKEMSDDSSLDKNYQIRVNQDGQNQLYVPCWEEEASSNTQYYHLVEQNKFFKNKCKHLEDHLEENHRQFSSLNQLYMMAEANERRLLKENQEFKRRNNDLVKELKQSSSACQEATSEVQIMGKRESDLRERLSKSKEREKQFIHKLEVLEKEMQLLRQKSILNQSRKVEYKEEQNKCKQYYHDEVDRIETKLKTAYNQLQIKFDASSQQLKQKTQEVKKYQKVIQTTSLQHQQQIKRYEEMMKDLYNNPHQKIYKLQNEVAVLTRINNELKDEYSKPNCHLFNQSKETISQITYLKQINQRLQQTIATKNQQQQKLVGEVKLLEIQYMNLKAEKQQAFSIRQQDQLRLKLTQVERELQLERSMTRGREQSRCTERQKLQHLEATLNVKDQQIQDLEEKIHHLQDNQEQRKIQFKKNERQQKVRDNQLYKKQKRNTQLLEQISILEAKNRQLEDKLQLLREETERMKTQLQLELNKNQKLKSNIESKLQSKQQFKLIQKQIFMKDNQIQVLKKQLKQLAQQNLLKNNSSQIELSLRKIIASLEEKIKAKQQNIKQLQIQIKSFQRDGSIDQEDYEALQEQYNRELIALKRLIASKGKQVESQQLKAEYESQAQIIISDYKVIQEEMLALRQQVIIQSRINSEPFRMRVIQQVWKEQIDRLSEQRQVLVQTVNRWQKKYEQMCYLFETKLQSKEEAINLLKLRLNNYQLSRGSTFLSPYH